MKENWQWGLADAVKSGRYGIRRKPPAYSSPHPRIRDWPQKVPTWLVGYINGNRSPHPQLTRVRFKTPLILSPPPERLEQQSFFFEGVRGKADESFLYRFLAPYYCWMYVRHIAGPPRSWGRVAPVKRQITAASAEHCRTTNNSR